MFSGVGHHDWWSGSIGIIDPRKGFNFPHGLTKVTARSAVARVQPHRRWTRRSRRRTTPRATTPATRRPIRCRRRTSWSRPAGEDGKFRLYLMDVRRQPRADLRRGAQRLARDARPAAHRRRRSSPTAWPGRARARTASRRSPASFYQRRRLPGRARTAARQRQVPARAPAGLQDLHDLGQDVSPLRPGGLDRAGGGGEAGPLRRAGRGRRLGLFQGAGRPVALLPIARRGTPLPADDAELRRRDAGRAARLRRLPRDAQHRAAAAAALALRRPPTRALAAALGHESISYERFAQPVLDRYCGKCHQGDGEGARRRST